MAAEFKLNHLAKTEPSLTRHPNIHKYYLSSCQTKITNRTPTTESWLKIVNALKLDDSSNYEKSRVLLGALDTHGEVVVKIGDSDDIRREYEYNQKLQSIKGFVKYICYFECRDNFRTVFSGVAPSGLRTVFSGVAPSGLRTVFSGVAPSGLRTVTPSKRTSLCHGPGNEMKIILMPWFPLGSMSEFKWQDYVPQLLISCLKHAILSMLTAFYKLSILHGDFHTGNVLLKKTKQKTISYEIPQLGTFLDIETYGIRPWIIDFENSKMANLQGSPYESMMSMNDFYFDVNKFFMLLLSKNKYIDPTTIIPIRGYMDSLHMKSTFPTRDNVLELLRRMDHIQFIAQ